MTDSLSAPVVLLDDVVLPGISRNISLPASTMDELAALWRLEGFGCVELLVVGPADGGSATSPENRADIGVAADAIVADDGDLTLLETNRVVVGPHREAPAAYREVWSGYWAPYTPAPPDQTGVVGNRIDELRKALASRLLADGRVERLIEVSPLLSQFSTSVAAWRSLYVAGELCLDDPEDRLHLLRFDEVQQGVDWLLHTLPDLSSAGPPKGELLHQLVSGGVDRLLEARDLIETGVWLARELNLASEHVDELGGLADTMSMASTLGSDVADALSE